MDPQMLTPTVLIDNGRSQLWAIENYTQDLYPYLQQLTLLEEPPIMVRGRQCHQRRNIGFYSDESIGYEYSNQMIPSQSLSGAPIMKWLLTEVNKSLGTKFNGILVNQYINGEKYLSAHSDNENGLDKTGRNMVAALCYGPGVRTFRIRDKVTNNIVLDYQHQPRTLLIMEGQFQSDYQHEIPIQKKVKEERISLTFRHHTK